MQNKAPWIIGCCVGLVFAAFGFLVHSFLSGHSDKRDLTCLSLNVYFEARGESTAGQYAVAEVTMNRVASRHYPDTVCAVVHQKNWDRLRKRYVSAFSWTEFDVRPMPKGEGWRIAQDVASAVYYGREAPQLDGATLYHATYIRPSWSRGKRPVARIGKHIFYKETRVSIEGRNRSG